MSYRDKTVDDIIFLFSSQNLHIQCPPDDFPDKQCPTRPIAFDPGIDVTVSA